MTDAGPNRRARDRLRREEDFLNAAEGLFAQRGFHQTSMEDVARAAEYATGTIYRYFASKQDLYNRLLLRKGTAYFTESQALIDAHDAPHARLQAMLHGKIKFFLENSEFFKIYITEVSWTDEINCPPRELRKLHDRYLQRLRDTIEQGVRDGSFRPLSVEMTVFSLMGMTNALLVNTLTGNIQVTAQELEEFVSDFVDRGLLARKGRGTGGRV